MLRVLASWRAKDGRGDGRGDFKEDYVTAALAREYLNLEDTDGRSGSQAKRVLALRFTLYFTLRITF